MTLVAADDWEPAGINEFEPSALDAVRDPGNTCVVAGPGAGKTEFLAQRAGFILQTGVAGRAGRILAISYKTDAARTLAARFAQRHPFLAYRLHSLTFDAFTKGLVDRFRHLLPEQWQLVDGYDLNFGYGGRVGQLTDRLDAPGWGSDVAIVNEWRAAYAEPGRPSLAFPMLNRLAELLVRSNAPLRRALRAAYPFVLVDEYQDTTTVQHDLLVSLFGGTSAVMTVVGDHRQRIMGFADAMNDSFSAVERDFDATRYTLHYNWRSRPELVALQSKIAIYLDDQHGGVASRRLDAPDPDAARLWTFAAAASHANHLADWISGEVDAGRRPEDFAVLARQKVADSHADLGPAFVQAGLRLLNINENVGSQSLEDLLSDGVARLTMALLRVATGRSPLDWQYLRRFIARGQGTDVLDDPVTRRREDQRLKSLIAATRDRIRDVAPHPDHIEGFVEVILEETGREVLAAVHAEYGRDAERLNNSIDDTVRRLRSVCVDAESWPAACDAFDGNGAVHLMTVHKSKGREYDTVVFIDIDDQSWWANAPHRAAYERTDSLAAFFVGLSRARDRVLFTHCSERGAEQGAASILAMLADAGVQRTDHA